jgi:hypothetical protein
VPEARKLVLELLAPDTLAARAVAHGVARLDHELADHAVEDDVVVVAVAGVRDEVLDGLGRGLGEEADGDVAVGGVKGGCGSCGGFAGFLFGLFGEVAGLFVVDVAFGFGDAGGWMRVSWEATKMAEGERVGWTYSFLLVNM